MSVGRDIGPIKPKIFIIWPQKKLADPYLQPLNICIKRGIEITEGFSEKKSIHYFQYSVIQACNPNTWEAEAGIS